MRGTASRQVYSREQVRRLCSISERQLRKWQKEKLVPASESFEIPDIIAIQALARLRKDGVSLARIRRALGSLRERLRDVPDPLREFRIFSDGKRIGVQMAGQKMEPISGQLLLDFDSLHLTKLRSIPTQPKLEDKELRARKAEAEHWFQRGLELEQTGAPIEEAIKAYQEAVNLDSASSGALVNLGTIFFNKRAWKDAERYYRKALEVDPEYALAHFNLANLFDEKGNRAEALHHYLAAIRVHGRYADAHYNLALLYQSSGQLMKALKHWKIYLKLDGSSSWAVIARREMQKLRQATVIRGARERASNGE
ncbi:MAG: tetratricopeptide repeat protein [Bryobacteraceae bacterium]|nr:tetratricopeptide repeat protein [Bryobacterales bacterium]MEB2363259.1 tetratricopeptide repeat protein [Bryobacterales bacterium]NUN02612.1 tetratricopeptide repeat protein [Bryobacteraceae bacterium]